MNKPPNKLASYLSSRLPPNLNEQDLQNLFLRMFLTLDELPSELRDEQIDLKHIVEAMEWSARMPENSFETSGYWENTVERYLLEPDAFNLEWAKEVFLQMKQID